MSNEQGMIDAYSRRQGATYLAPARGSLEYNSDSIVICSQPAASVPFALPEELSRDFLLQHRLCPKTRKDDDSVVVAAAPGAALEALDDIAFAYRSPVTVESTSQDEVERLIERLTSTSERELELLAVGALDSLDDDDDATADVRDLATQAPVVRYVNLLVRDANDARASDVHLEATRHGLSARFRIDGLLVDAPPPPPQLQHAVVSRLKLIAELDISERRKPQDGRIRVRLAMRELDLRVSTVPTMHGESVVLRLLDRGEPHVQLDALGLSPEMLQTVEALAARPHGMLLVTGPTGSGKTTTLYACLGRRDGTREKIITIEDPIEYELSGVTQVPVHRQAGVDFSSALRSILRQDPDVIMVGEMRDEETAEIAVQAALTGHLVLTTLHTNDALGAVPRLLDLGVPDFLVAATVNGVLTQRLVRRICDRCRETYEPRASERALLGTDVSPDMVLSRGVGCAACRGTGFKGRVGIFELLLIGDELRDAIARRAPRSTLHAQSRSGIIRTLRDDGFAKVLTGITTVDEVCRVVQQ